jgi:serine/threonine protein kinase
LKLGRYEIVRELGKGAMGIVYLAKDPLIGRLVALKTIRPVAHSDDDEAKEFQQRFIREAQAAGILNHASIVTVHDIGQDESGTSFIAMEYVEGQNLKELIAQGKPIPFEQVAEVIAQVAEALDFAHSRGIVHRDVKPANIILVEGNRAKITDFGIAKIASSVANLTTTGQFLGTPNYMAPEQIKGAPVDGRTDIFSLGICLYECLTRRKPFGGDSLTSISYKIVHEPFPPLRDANPEIPDGFEEVVATSLAKEPGRRFQRGRDMAAALRAVMRGEKPIRHEPIFAEETVVTRDRDRIPTIEMPFPEASGSFEVSNVGTPIAAGAAGGSIAPPIAPVIPRVPRAPRPPLAQQFRTTLTNVRAFPLWRHPLHPALFLGIVAVLILALFGAIASVRSRTVDVPAVDVRAEAQRARERRLRIEGNELLRQGRVQEAYARFEELSKLAPNSPHVIFVMTKLAQLRQEEEIGKQQLALAKLKLDEGIALFNARKYPEAITVLQQSFSLNPNADEAANYLKLAQQEEMKAQAAKAPAATKAGTPPGTTRRPTPGKTAAAAPESTAPARLTTIFNSPVADGYVMVRSGGEVVAHENLYEEARRLFRRRTPRNISVTRDVTPKNADLEVWVIIPSMRVNERHVMKSNLQPGGQYRLTIAFDPKSKQFNYSLN